MAPTAVPTRRGSSISRSYRPAQDATSRTAHPSCECSPDCTEVATDVDHRDGSGPHGDNRWVNLMAMAHGHHSAKTVERDGGFGRPRRKGP